MPYKSDSQRKFFHTQTARSKGITPDVVKEFDQASKGMKLPGKVHNESKEPKSEERVETPSQEKAERYTGHGFAMGAKHMGPKKPY